MHNPGSTKKQMYVVLVWLGACIFFACPVSLLGQSAPPVPDPANVAVDWPNGPSYKSPLNPYAAAGYGGQSTAFAWGRAHEVLGTTQLPPQGSANTWYARSSFAKGTVPQANSIAVWQGDSHNPYGHVAFIESVSGDSVVLNEANIETFSNTNVGGGYDGHSKTLTFSRLTNRGRGIGKLIGYIYLTNPPTSDPPTISAISPEIPNTNGSNQDLTVYGTNFKPGLSVSTVMPSGAAGPNISGGQITSLASGSFVMSISLAQGGLWSIKVTNSDSSQSNTFTFKVHQAGVAAPTVTSINPASFVNASGIQDITVSGSNFVNGLRVVLTPPGAQPASTFSGSQLANITANSFVVHATLNAPGIWSLQVINADGGRSNPFAFVVQQAASGNPIIVSVNPANPTAANAEQDVTVSGSNFQSGLTVSVLRPGGLPAATLAGAKILNVTSTSFVMRVALNAAGNWKIRVNNPDGGRSLFFGFNVQPATVQNPTISQIQPATPTSSTTPQDLTVMGSGFQANLSVSVFMPGGLPGTALSGPSQILNVTANSFVMRTTLAIGGTWIIQVNNPDGGRSAQFWFRVDQPGSQLPSITSISPASPTASAGSQNVTVNGSNFQTGLTVTLTKPNSQTVTLSGAQIQNVNDSSFVFAFDFAGVSGAYSIRVNNPANGGQSNTFGFNVQSEQTPTIISISPPSPTATAGTQPISVTGTNFVSGLTVTVTYPDAHTEVLSGAAIQNVTATSFSFDINFNKVFGAYSIRVTNPDASVSNPFGFTVQAVSPAVQSISPPIPAATGANQPITIGGSDFQAGLTLTLTKPDLSTQNFIGGEIQNFTSTSFVVQMNLTAVGSYSVKVTNPDTKQSNSLVFSVSVALPAPVISSINPASPPATNSLQVITVNGQNFQDGLGVTLTHPDNHTTELSSFQIGPISGDHTNFQISINFGGVGGNYGIRVNRADGQQSNTFNFAVQSPSPVVTGISPAIPAATSSNQPITITGSNFLAGLTVTLTKPDNSPIQFTGGEIQNLTAGSFVIQVNFNGVTGNYSIKVKNPDNQESNSLAFSVSESLPAPVIGSISPATPKALSALQNITVTGQNFQTGLGVTFTYPDGHSADLSSFQIGPVSGDHTNFAISVNFNGIVGNYAMRVNRADGQQSNTFAFTVEAPDPVISAVNPTLLLANNTPQSVTISGTEFQAGLILELRDPNNNPQNFSGAQIQNFTTSSFVVSMNFGNLPGTYTVKVTNLNGKISNSFQFAVTVPGPNPVVTSISPASPTAQAGNQQITVNGNDFQSGLTVTLVKPDGTNVVISNFILNLTPTSFDFLTTALNQPGSYSIQVKHQDGGQSNVFAFTVVP